jgi:hypothetical protein
MSTSDSDERLVTAWSRWPGGYWVIERSWPARYATRVLFLSFDEQLQASGRVVRLFEHGIDPNA